MNESASQSLTSVSTPTVTGYPSWLRWRARSIVLIALCGALSATLAGPLAQPADAEDLSLRPGGSTPTSSPVVVGSDHLSFRGHATPVRLTQGPSRVDLQRELRGTVVFGDWNGDGIATPGAFADGRWSLHDQLDAGDDARTFWFGRAGDHPLVGDWNGNGRDTIGIRRDATFHLRNHLSGGTADISTTFGRAGDHPLVGDWNGNGRDTIGMRRDARLFLSDDNRTATTEFNFGRSGETVAIWPGARAVHACPTAAWRSDQTHGALVGMVESPDLGTVSDGDPDLQLALQTANDYFLDTRWEEKWAPAGNVRGYLDIMGSRWGALEHAVRPPAMAAASLSIGRRLGMESTAGGVSAGEASDRAVMLVRSIACQHQSVTMGGWGDGWQSSYWAQFAGVGAWLLWEDLDTDARFYVARMIEDEADRLADTPIRYWRDASGIGPLNTLAEVMAWDSSLLSLAATMMPTHPHQPMWLDRSVAYAVAAGAMPHDLDSVEPLHGTTTGSWVNGWNITEDALVFNHNRISPDYSTAMHAAWSGGLFHSLAGNTTPRGLFHNGDRIYGALSTHPFPTGTVYVPGSSEIRYPEGSSWSVIQRAQFVNMDAMAHVFGLDGSSSHPALEFQRLHTTGQLELQARHADGRTYKDATEHRYPGREELTAHLLAYARLAEHIGAAGRFETDDRPLTPVPQPSPTAPPPTQPSEPTESETPPSEANTEDMTPLVGDIDGDGQADLGWWSAGAWSLTTSGGDRLAFRYGRATDVPLLGDWNGDGRVTPGVKRGTTYFLSNALRGGPADYSFTYGRDGDVPLVGDWNADGRDTIGVRRNATFLLSNAPRGGPADLTFTYGRSSDVPIVGDWNGDGRTTPGIRRSSEYHLSNAPRGGPADYSFFYGRASDRSIAGDFNGDGRDTISIVRDGVFHINDAPRGGPASRTVSPATP